MGLEFFWLSGFFCEYNRSMADEYKRGALGGFAGEYAGGGCECVGGCSLGDLEGIAVEIFFAAFIDDPGKARPAEGDIGHAPAEWSAGRVGDDHSKFF